MSQRPARAAAAASRQTLDSVIRAESQRSDGSDDGDGASGALESPSRVNDSKHAAPATPLSGDAAVASGGPRKKASVRLGEGTVPRRRILHDDDAEFVCDAGGARRNEVEAMDIDEAENAHYRGRSSSFGVNDVDDGLLSMSLGGDVDAPVATASSSTLPTSKKPRQPRKTPASQRSLSSQAPEDAGDIAADEREVEAKAIKPLKRNPKMVAADNVAVSQALSALHAAAVREGPGRCRCQDLKKMGTAPELKSLARRVERLRREADEQPFQPFPTTLTEAIAHLCPHHLHKFEAVHEVLKPAVGAKSPVERFAQQIEIWLALAPGERFSVLQAYVRWIVTTYLPSKPALAPVDAPDRVLFMRLLPHLVRDVVDNHEWHIVEGWRRVDPNGTEQAANGLENLPEFGHTMTNTVCHYVGAHEYCGLSRTRNRICVESINIGHSVVLVAAVADMTFQVARFITMYNVTDIYAPYADQNTLRAQFP